MCSEMSQYMPSTATSSEMPNRIDGTEAQAGSPVWRSAQLPKVFSAPMLPLRCPRIRRTTRIVATSAPAVAPTASPIAAPPAGS